MNEPKNDGGGSVFPGCGTCLGLTIRNNPNVKPETDCARFYSWGRLHAGGKEQMNHNLFPTLHEPRSYTRCMDIEREIKLNGIIYLCNFEVSIRFWEDDAKYPELDCVSKCQAFDNGGHQVTDAVLLGQLDAMVTLYAKDNLVDLADDFQRLKG